MNLKLRLFLSTLLLSIGNLAYAQPALDLGYFGPGIEERALRWLWVLFFQPMLFGLIGYELSFEYLTME